MTSEQASLDLRPPRSGESLKLALSLLLHSRHFGRENAATWETLRDELVAEGVPPMHVRRLQEAVEDLVEHEGAPIVGQSNPNVGRVGICWAARAAEVKESLDEQDKRARKSLRKRRLLRKAYFDLLGQERLMRRLMQQETSC